RLLQTARRADIVRRDVRLPRSHSPRRSRGRPRAHRGRPRDPSRVRRCVGVRLGPDRSATAAGVTRKPPSRSHVMKLVRYGRAGVEKPGLIDSDGKLRDLARVVKDITPEVLSPAGLKRLRGVNVERLPVVGGRPRLGPPLTGIGKMVCIGLNYSDHAREVGRPAPDEPTLFIKANSSINGPSDPIVRPRGAVKLDYEVEFAAVLGRDARYVKETDALKYV